MNTGAEAGAIAAAATIVQAIKASGVIVSVEPRDLLFLVELNNEPIAVHATTGLFTTKHQYLTSYRGLAFYTKSEVQLTLPGHCQLIEAKKIWVPG